jgi:hypothetical protein
MSLPRTAKKACGSALGQQSAVGVEQHVGAAVFQIAHHAGQRLDHHRLADAMQNDARYVRKLVDDTSEQLPAHIGGRLEIFEGARAGFAQQIAAIGRLDVKANRLLLGNLAARVADGFEIAPRVGSRLRSHWHAVLLTFCWKQFAGRYRRRRV